MRTLPLFLLLISASLPAFADRDDDRGKPFDRLQEQIDKLRQRIQTLEAASPAGQICPPGEFVTGFNSAGAILCATPTAGTPTPPPPPAPIPASFQLALQQAFNQFAGQGLPVPPNPPLTQTSGQLTVTTQALSYDLAIGAVQMTQSSASAAAIQIIVPNIAVNLAATTTLNGVTRSGTVTISSGATVTINVTVVTTPGGTRRLASVTAIDLVPGPLSATGSDPNIVSIFQQAITVSPQIAQFLASNGEQLLSAAMDQFQVLASLPDF